MYRLVSKLIVYKKCANTGILAEMADICRRFHEEKYDRDEMISDIYTQINSLLDIATIYGFNGNLWHDYLSYVLASSENPFTLASEKSADLEGSVNIFFRNDMEIFKELFDYDFSEIENELGISCFSVISSYEAVEKSSRIVNMSVSEKVRELAAEIEKAKSPDETAAVVKKFYATYGVGKLGLNKAFRIGEEPEKQLIQPVTSIGSMTLDDLIGYDEQKQKLIENTEAFVNRRPANNVLLYGDAGTGKSTSVKALLNMYYSRGLRMIEVYKHQFRYLNQVISEIKNRNYRFIIFMDDLSFEEYETEYKYLKAVIEGGLEIKPDNVLIYATSNRRHLIRETWNDRPSLSDEEIHRSDTMQEKLSLFARFGVTIGYYKPAPKEFYRIVEGLAQRHPEIKLTKEELDAEANKWELRSGGASGRTAQQFIDYLTGTGNKTI